VAEFCEYSNEPKGSIQGGGFLLDERLPVSQEGLCFMELLISVCSFPVYVHLST
jgi:hypothetical protein